MTERVHIVLPLSIIDELWPTGITLLSRRDRSSAYWIDLLSAQVDRGVLYVNGRGSEDDPYRYSWVVPPREVVSTLYDESTRTLLARHGLMPEMTELELARWEWDAS